MSIFCNNWHIYPIKKNIMDLSYMHSLYTCNHILYIICIAMYVSICPSMIYILNSYKISRAEFVLFVNPMFHLVCSASVEPPVDWERHRIFYDLINRHKVTYCQSYITLLWIWVMLWEFINYFFIEKLVY